MRIFIVDPHTLFREGLKNAITAVPDLTVVGEVAGLQDLGASANACDVLTLYDTIEAVGFVRSFYEQSGKGRVPFILVFADQPLINRAIRYLTEGAAGYVSKSEPADRILQAIRTVARGRKFITPDVAEALAENVTDNVSRSISSREYEVLYYLASGSSVSEIAAGLNLSVKTVSTYRTRLLQKLHLSNNSGLIRYAVREKIVQLDSPIEQAGYPGEIASLANASSSPNLSEHTPASTGEDLTQKAASHW